MKAVATFAFAVSAVDLEPDYSAMCSGIGHPVDASCNVAMPPSNLPVEFRGSNDTREFLTFTRSVTHVCQYPGPETVDCEDIPTDAATIVTSLLCGTCSGPSYGIKNEIKFDQRSYWAHFCSSDGTKAWRQQYWAVDGSTALCGSEWIADGHSEIIDLPRQDTTRCDKTGICSARMPPRYCNQHFSRGCQQCEKNTCTGCCDWAGGDGSESVTATQVWHSIRDARFHCDAGSCKHALSGGVPSLSDCRSACGQGSAFQCLDDQCVPAQGGVGKIECEAVCGATVI